MGYQKVIYTTKDSGKEKVIAEALVLPNRHEFIARFKLCKHLKCYIECLETKVKTALWERTAQDGWKYYKACSWGPEKIKDEPGISR